MHRDIKLDNIGLVAVQPPQAVLLDFGHATRAKSSTNHMRGTVRYLAPEVLALKEDAGSAPYTNQVDTWALGVCLYEVFRESFIRWKAVNESHYRNLREGLTDELTSPADRYEDHDAVQSLMLVMLRSIVWDPLKRLSARHGLLALGGEDGQGKQEGRDPAVGTKRRQDD